MATYTGRCHCGRIRFEVEGELRRVSQCNCSICTLTAYLHWVVEPGQVKLLCNAGAWSSYRFGTRVAEHRFCPTCGVSPFRIARSDPDKIDVNARCLEGVEPDALELEAFDGRHWEAAMRAERGSGWRE